MRFLYDFQRGVIFLSIGMARENEIDFSTARKQLMDQIEAWQSKSQSGLVELPRFQLSQGETSFVFGVPKLDGAAIFQALEIIKNHSPRVYVHTLEPGYTIFQDGEAGQLGTKFRFVYIGQQKRIEVSHSGNFIPAELECCLRLFEAFAASPASQNPSEQLRALGVPVYRRKSKAAVQPAECVADLNQRYNLAGYDQTKEAVLENVILPLCRPEMFHAVAELTRGSKSGVLPKAVLFEGPPGVGKTSMAKLIAAETGIPLVYVPVENITSKYYGQSAQNMAQIFEIASAYEQVILFLDEIDSLGLSREGGLFEASRRILSVLLRKIDGMDARPGVITIGATNRRDDLDRALLSRFDTIINFPLPNSEERAAIFARYARQLSEAERKQLGAVSPGLSGRNIEDICEFVERRWSRQLLVEKRSLDAPPFAMYEQVCQERLSAMQNPAL
ncbi:MAG: ATP-binding protein [Leptospiraceae bacterium]|nr:ATP-binding protein [Leptospiraceae bacterium]